MNISGITNINLFIKTASKLADAKTKGMSGGKSLLSAIALGGSAYYGAGKLWGGSDDTSKRKKKKAKDAVHGETKHAKQASSSLHQTIMETAASTALATVLGIGVRND